MTEGLFDKFVPQGKRPVDKEVLNDEFDAMRAEMENMRFRERIVKRYGAGLTDAQEKFYADILREEDRQAVLLAARKVEEAKQKAIREAADADFLVESHPEYVIYCNDARCEINHVDRRVKGTLDNRMLQIRDELMSRKRLGMDQMQYIGVIIPNMIGEDGKLYKVLRVP